MSECDYKVSVLLHWNIRKQREETWLLFELDRSMGLGQRQRIREVATGMLNRKPNMVIPAGVYLRGESVENPANWLAGPITDEEADIL